MFPLRFRLCQKGKEYEINTWSFYSKLLEFFIPNFPLALPSHADWLSCWQGPVLEPPVLTENGARPGHCGGSWGKATAHWSSSKAKLHLLWPQTFFPCTYRPQRSSQSYSTLLINPGFLALGKVTLFIKMPLWAPKRKTKGCSTMVIRIQRKRKIRCALPSH